MPNPEPPKDKKPDQKSEPAKRAVVKPPPPKDDKTDAPWKGGIDHFDERV